MKILSQIYVKVRDGSAHNIMHKSVGKSAPSDSQSYNNGFAHKQLTAMPSQNMKPDIIYNHH